MSILIVEDDEIISMLIERILQSQHYQTLKASTGTEALKGLRSHPEIELIVADIMMPEMNGLDLLRAMKDSPHFRDTPVIFCTMAMDPEKVRMAANLGCCYYLLKPVKRDLLLQKVAQVLSKASPALAPMREVMRKYGFNQTSYLKAAQAFTSLLDTEIQSLRSTQLENGGLGREPHFQPLAQGAETFGARQLLAHIEAQLASSNPQRNLRDLLWEMQRVLELLKAQIARSTLNPEM